MWAKLMELPKKFGYWTRKVPKKPNNTYCVEGVTNVRTTRPDGFPVTVVYRNTVTGELWSRPLTEWTERMKLLKDSELDGVLE